MLLDAGAGSAVAGADTSAWGGCVLRGKSVLPDRDGTTAVAGDVGEQGLMVPGPRGVDEELGELQPEEKFSRGVELE